MPGRKITCTDESRSALKGFLRIILHVYLFFLFFCFLFFNIQVFYLDRLISVYLEMEDMTGSDKHINRLVLLSYLLSFFVIYGR